MTPACFGVLCPRHGECARYHAVDGLNRMDERIGTCHDGEAYPLFVLKEENAVDDPL